MKNLKILEICEFSAGICGVWQRVRQEASLLSQAGNKVFVFSSNIVKGTDKIAPKYEKVNGVKIFRFNHETDVFDNLLTKNVTYFNFEKKFNEINPDIVITHTIHPHSFKALKLCLKKNIPCFLVTHAPFNVKRGFLLNLATKIYYSFNVKPKLRKFSKIIAITKWELHYLHALGVSKEKIIYIPNGIPEEFFKKKIGKYNAKKILFLGRIAPVKNLEILFKAFENIKQKNRQVELEIIGPIEQGYEQIKKFQTERIKFLPPIYNLNEKIQKLNEAGIFVLPSIREAMPQALIEAMSLGKIVISSCTDGGKEIIQDGKTGFLFKIGDEKELANKILFCLDNKNIKKIEQIRKNAREKSKEFKWTFLIKKLESLL